LSRVEDTEALENIVEIIHRCLTMLSPHRGWRRTDAVDDELIEVNPPCRPGARSAGRGRSRRQRGSAACGR
jgi:hypothetical protein